jgi:hypothetical protein
MNEPPDHIKRLLKDDPRVWARNTLRHPNDPSRPYDFWDDVGPPPEDFDGTTDDWDGDFLYYLADDDGPMNPEQWGDINVLLFARGCLKTWTTTTIASWATDMFASIEGVATAPVDDQRGEVIDRFKTKVEQSGMIDRRVKDNMGHQKFRNQAVDNSTGESYVAYSHLKSRSAWNDGDKLRGLHAHFGIIDESQDVDEGTFSTFLEAIDRKQPDVDYFPTIFVIGTPKMANTFFHKLWKMSDQRDWDGNDKAWVAQQDGQEFLPEAARKEREELAEKIQELQEKRDQAVERGNDVRVDEIDELLERFREEHDELEGFEVHGWHIDQHNSPLHDRTNIAFKKETYSKRKFKNEVEAEFYSPENDLITRQDVFDTAFVDEPFAVGPQHDDATRVLGVDWGGGQGEGAANTVIMVAEERPDESMHVLNFDILDSDLSHADERKQIDRWMQKYDVDIGVVDEGLGDTDREELQDEYGYDERGEQTIYGCWYGNVGNKEEVKWNRHNERKRYFTCAKTFMVEHMTQDFKHGHISVPREDLAFDSRRSDGTMLVDQLTAPYTESKTLESGKTKKIIESERNDDIFDALTYCWIALNKVQSQRTLKQIGSHNRAGYR